MDERSARVAAWFEVPVLVAAVLVIPTIVLEEIAGEPWNTLAAVLNWAIWLVFAAELVALLVVVRDRWRWLREHPLEVAVVVLTPPLVPSSLQSIRALRLLRLLRLFRAAQVLRRVFTVEGLRYAALVALLVVLGGGAAFAAVEDGWSTWDGVWWAVTTMTTVGYGDISPETDAGRVLGIAVMLVGIGFVALLTGAVAERFLKQEVEEELAEAETTEGEVLAELRAITARLHKLEGALERQGRGA
jgi:voltage-gated potassium channel